VFFVKPDDVRGIANLMSGLLSTQIDVELQGTGQQESYSWAEYSEELLQAITK
jgi:hypothetical protein